MSRVFIIETPSVNVEKANRYGQIVILINQPPKISALNSDYFAGMVIEELENHEFNPKDDYFCLVGSMSSIAVTVASLVVRWGDIRCLLFNASRNDYCVRTLGKWRATGKWEDEEEKC